MIKLRLKRFGKKREASYRIIAINSTSRRQARPLEELGFYNPRTDEVRLDVDGISRRLQQGAQPTDTVRDILIREKILPETARRFVPVAEPTEASTPVAEAATEEADA